MLGHDKAARAYRPRESPVIIDCAHYRDGRRQEAGPVSLEDAAARTKQGGFVWLGLFEPDPEEFEQVRSAFNLHELAVEDAQIEHMRPKVEAYGGQRSSSTGASYVSSSCAPPAMTMPRRRWSSDSSASSSRRPS